MHHPWIFALSSYQSGQALGTTVKSVKSDFLQLRFPYPFITPLSSQCLQSNAIRIDPKNSNIVRYKNLRMKFCSPRHACILPKNRPFNGQNCNHTESNLRERMFDRIFKTIPRELTPQANDKGWPCFPSMAKAFSI